MTKKIIVALLVIFTAFCNTREIFAYDNITKNLDVIEPNNSVNYVFKFTDVTINVENTLDLISLRGTVDDVSGKIYGVSSVAYYINSGLSKLYDDELTIVSTTRIDDYNIQVRLCYKIYYVGFTGKDLIGTYYRNVTCKSPGPIEV